MTLVSLQTTSGNQCVTDHFDPEFLIPILCVDYPATKSNIFLIVYHKQRLLLWFRIVVMIKSTFNLLKKQNAHIIDSLREGKNSIALEHLYKSIFPKVRRYITRNSGSRDDAFDIFQDAIVILCKQLQNGRYDESADVAGFIYTVSRNLWINKAKREKRKINIPSTGGIDIPDEFDFTTGIKFSLDEKLYQQIIRELGKKCYELLKLALYYDKTNEEILSEMRFSTLNAVKTQKYKCKQKMIGLMETHSYLKEMVE